MRLIGTLGNEKDALRFISFLQKKGIDGQCDPAFDIHTGYMSYQIWIMDEDKINDAKKEFDQFVLDPTSALFDRSPLEEEAETAPRSLGNEAIPRQVPTPVTALIIAFCALIFLFNLFEEYPMFKEGLSEKTFLVTPIQSEFLFDLPDPIVQLEAVIEKQKIDPNQKMETLSPEIQDELKIAMAAPFWKGGYDWILLKIQGKNTAIAEGPLFHKILQGEVWRLVTPIFLHGEFLHILFNMIWVWVLCRPIEQRIGVFRLLLLTCIIAIGSNISQYLMSGPFFIGYSGVVLGLAGFTWGREKIAPWEGYPMASTTILFLLLFIGGMFLLQSVSFFLQIFTPLDFSPNIANTAHITGAFIGWGLARVPFFSEIAK